MPKDKDNGMRGADGGQSHDGGIQQEKEFIHDECGQSLNGGLGGMTVGGSVV